MPERRSSSWFFRPRAAVLVLAVAVLVGTGGAGSGDVAARTSTPRVGGADLASVTVVRQAPAGTVGSGGTWVENTVAPRNVGLGPLTCASADDCIALGFGSGGAGVGAWATIDGGLSWDEQVPPGAQYLSAASCAPGTTDCWAVGRVGDNQGAVIDATTDAGATWSAQTVPPGITGLLGISCADAMHCVAVGADDHVGAAADAVTSNGGATWTEYTDRASQDDFLFGVSCGTPLDCVAIGFLGGSYSSAVLVSHDGGVTWHDELFSRAYYDPWAGVSCPSALDCFVVGSKEEVPGPGPNGGLIEATTDGGATWTAEPPPAGTNAIFDISCPSASVCWATGQRSQSVPAEFLATTDGGMTWTFEPAAVEPGAASIACVSVSVCDATNQSGDVLSTRDAQGAGCQGDTVGGGLVGIAPAPDGEGYWLASPAGGVLACGGASFYGSPISTRTTLHSPIVGFAATNGGCGYYLLARDGTVYPFGPCARTFPQVRSSAPFVGIVTDPTGTGYWLASSDGGAFAVGARYHGSVPGAGVRTDDIVGIATAPAGGGYWLAGADGGVFSFALPYHGSLPGLAVRVHDIVSISTASVGVGYLLAGADGGVFALGGGVRYCGSADGHTTAPVSALATYGLSPGYWLVERGGRMDDFDAPFEGTSVPETGRPARCGS